MKTKRLIFTLLFMIVGVCLYAQQEIEGKKTSVQTNSDTPTATPSPRVSSTTGDYTFNDNKESYATRWLPANYTEAERKSSLFSLYYHVGGNFSKLTCTGWDYKTKSKYGGLYGFSFDWYNRHLYGAEFGIYYSQQRSKIEENDATIKLDYLQLEVLNNLRYVFGSEKQWAIEANAGLTYFIGMTGTCKWGGEKYDLFDKHNSGWALKDGHLAYAYGLTFRFYTLQKNGSSWYLRYLRHSGISDINRDAGAGAVYKLNDWSISLAYNF